MRRRSGPLRVALVGAGYIADFHVAVLRAIPSVEVVAVVDPNQDRARDLASRHSIPNALSEIAALAALGVDVAHLLVPPDLHARLTRELLALGIGAFVEKPLVLSSAEARELGREAARRGLPLGANHNNLYHPAFVRLLERVRAGEIGRVEHVQATLSVPLPQLDAADYGNWMFAAPENIVFEQAVHPLCQVHALIGKVGHASPTVLSTRELAPGQVFHDRWAMAATGERGTAELLLAFGRGFTRNRIEVLGSDGALEADLARDTLSGERKTRWLDFWDGFLASWRRGGALRRDARRVLARYARFTLGIGRREDAFFAGMRGSIEAFHRALAAGAPPPVGAGDAAEVLAWCEALARAAAGPARAVESLAAPGPVRAGEVVVLGANGFIGRRVIAGLLGAGLPTTAIVRRTRGLPHEFLAAARDGRLRVLVASLEDAPALARAVEGARAVVHLATGGGATWQAIERSMIGGTRALAEACLAGRVERVVYASSIAALDTGGDRAIEDDEPTDRRPGARSLYARGKIAAEHALLELHRSRSLPVTIVRPGVVLGSGTPMQHSGLGLWVRDNHCVGWGAGEHPLPLVWVDDVAGAIVALVRHGGRDLDGRALNLCSRVPLSARQVVDELRRVTGRDVHFHARALPVSQAMEIGKWLVKKAGRRRGVDFPSWRDLRARSLAAPFTSRTAREVLGWRPVEEREAFLDRAVRIYAPSAP